MFQSYIKKNSFIAHAPCKINLHLSIGKKQPDGFHSINSIFAAVDYGDTLVFNLLRGNKGKTKLSIRAQGPLLPFLPLSLKKLPLQENLVYKSVELYRKETGFSRDIKVELIKRIPPGSGLGGGSSDAATALIALNSLANFSILPQSTQLWKAGECPPINNYFAIRRALARPCTEKNEEFLSMDTLLGLSAQLGSDVPFFTRISEPGFSPVCAVSGRGEILEPLPSLPPLGVLLVFPGFPSETGAAYQRLEARRSHRNQFSINLPRNTQSYTEKNGTIPAGDAWPSPETWSFYNDFQDLFLQDGSEQEKTAYSAILNDLKSTGSSFYSLSGSGSGCFGIFNSVELAKQAQKALSGKTYSLIATFFLQSKQ